MTAPRYAIFDIDGTLADVGHRLHYIDKAKDSGKRQWGKFFAESVNDKPIFYVHEMLQMLATFMDIYLMTGRPESERERTREWLEQNCISYDNLFMRPDKDRRPDFEVKRDLFLEHFSERKDECFAIFEDRLPICKQWKDMGLPVYVCGNDWVTGKWDK